jgi:uncharacterized coiled-coil protein SlyX
MADFRLNAVLTANVVNFVSAMERANQATSKIQDSAQRATLQTERISVASDRTAITVERLQTRIDKLTRSIAADQERLVQLTNQLANSTGKSSTFIERLQNQIDRVTNRIAVNQRNLATATKELDIAGTAGAASINRMNYALQGIQAIAAGTGIVMLVNLLTAMGTAAANAVGSLITINKELQQMRIGLAAVISNSNELKDTVTGELLEGQEKYNRALAISRQLMQELQIDAATNYGTTQDLIEMMQMIEPFVARTGKEINGSAIEATRKLANDLMAAYGVFGPSAIKGGKDQIVREAGEILAGNFRNTNKFANLIGLTREDMDEAKKNGTSLFDLLESKMAGLAQARNALADSFEGISNTLQDAVQITSARIGSGLFEQIIEGMKTVRDLFFVKSNDGLSQLAPDMKRFADALSPVIAQLGPPLLKLTKDFVNLFLENKDLIISFIQLLVQLLNIVINTLDKVVLILRAALDIVSPIFRAAMDGLSSTASMLNYLLGIANDFMRNVLEKLGPVFQKIGDIYSATLGKALQEMMKAMGQNAQVTDQAAQNAADAGAVMQTKLLPHVVELDDKLNKQNKTIKDNTQHWKNWITTISGAMNTRLPSIASSLGAFAGAGALNATSGGTLVKLGPSGGVIIPIHVNGNQVGQIGPLHGDPQQMMQAQRQAQQLAGALAYHQSSYNIPRSGARISNPYGGQ